MYAPDKDEPPAVVEVNGFAVRAWKSDLADACRFDLDGVTGTARAHDSQKHDWIWISVDGAPLPDLGTDCFLRVTDGNGRVVDTSDGQNVEMLSAKKSDQEPAGPLRSVVFRIPPRWSSTDKVTLELYSQKTLLAAWNVSGVAADSHPVPGRSPAQAKADDMTFVAEAVAEYETRPNGSITSRGFVDVRLDDPQDRELRWVAEVQVGQSDPVTVVGRGKVAQRLPIPGPIEPGANVPVKAKLYAFTTRAALSYYVFCSMKELEDGTPQFRSGANVIVPLPGGGRFSVKDLFAKGKRRDDGTYDFTFPCRWTVGGKTLVGRPLGVGGTVPAMLRATRGTVVPTLTPQDTFTLRMTADEVEYLKGDRFTFEMWFENRRLVAETSLDKTLVCAESPIWTQRAALARSDEMTHAGE